jgi:16S rRNA (cytosine967-C5)-methyltransferase
MPISPARRAAFDILMQADRGGFASDLLAALPAALDRRDINLATELVLGCLRRQNQLDHLIRVFSGRAGRLDAEVLVALRLGIYQLRHLDRVPRHAVVNDSVALTRAARKASATGFVNAVLRKVDARPVEFPTPAVAAGLPEWLYAKWAGHFDSAIAAALEIPQTYLHVPPGREDDARALGAEATDVPGCFRLPNGSDSGPFRIQDIGSQSLVPLLRLDASHRFLDLCAAPGNKTAQALEANPRQAVAADHSVKRLHAIRPLGVPLVALDATCALPFPACFDRILVDAPCSGTGTLARNPEIRWRLQPQDLARHHARQTAILTHALAVLAPGGCLVYSTCSLEPEENEAVVDEVLGAVGQQFALDKTVRRIPGREPGDGFFAGVIKSSVTSTV